MLKRRDLICELVAKDLRVRYSRPVLGFFWSVLSPLLIVGIFYLVFSVILRVEIREAPFILYLMSAVFPWRFFQDSVLTSTTSLIDNKNLIKESNFPQHLVPLSVVLSNFINFLPSLGILLVTSIIYLKGLPIYIVLLPVVIMAHFIITISISLIVSIIYIKFRDIKYILDAALQMMFYLTPAFYPISLIRDSFGDIWLKAYVLNPFVGILDLYRSAILKGYYTANADLDYLSLFIVPVIGFSLAIFCYSIYFYNKNKGTINDHLSY